MMSYTIKAPGQTLIMPKSNRKINFGLSEANYNRLVDKLKQGDESILKHIAQNHFPSCIKYLVHNCKVSEDRAYDLCLDTMLIFRKKLLEDRISYGNLNYLYTRMAKNALVDRIKKDKKLDSAIDLFMDQASEDSKDNESKMYRALELSISELDQGSHKLIKEIFFTQKDIHEVAKQHNISYAALRKRKQRLLEKLRIIIEKNISKIQ